MRFKDTHGEGTITLNKRTRAAILSHLSNASSTVTDQKHPLHMHLKKAAGEIGAIVDRSEDDGEQSTAQDRNLTSPGEVDRDFPARRVGAPQAEGASDLARRAAGVRAMDLFKSAGSGEFEQRREIEVRTLYKAAASERNPVKKAALEKLAYELDKVDVRDLQQRSTDLAAKNVVGSRGPNRGWMQRHGFGA
jgi:hypothetical protein